MMKRPAFRIGWQVFWATVFAANAAHRIYSSFNDGQLAVGLFVSGLGFLLLSYIGFKHPIVIWPRLPRTENANPLGFRDWLALVGFGFVGVGTALMFTPTIN